jgi:hypothetical protein
LWRYGADSHAGKCAPSPAKDAGSPIPDSRQAGKLSSEALLSGGFVRLSAKLHIDAHAKLIANSPKWENYERKITQGFRDHKQ